MKKLPRWFLNRIHTIMEYNNYSEDMFTTQASPSGSGCLSPEGDGVPLAISVQSLVPCVGLAVS